MACGHRQQAAVASPSRWSAVTNRDDVLPPECRTHRARPIPFPMNVSILRLTTAAALVAAFCSGQQQRDDGARRHAAQPGVETRGERLETARKPRTAATADGGEQTVEQKRKALLQARERHEPGTDPKPENGMDDETRLRRAVHELLEGNGEEFTDDERARFRAMVREMAQRAHARREERRDQREDVRDQREDVRDAQREGGRLDRAEDRRDTREDGRDGRVERTDKPKVRATERSEKVQKPRGPKGQ